VPSRYTTMMMRSSGCSFMGQGATFLEKHALEFKP